MDDFEKLRRVLRDTLNLGSSADSLTVDSRLLGAVPQLDSMAIVSILAAIEQEYGIEIGGDELSAELFSTAGTLNEFIAQKLHSGEVTAAQP